MNNWDLHIEQLIVEKISGTISEEDSSYLDGLIETDAKIKEKWEKEEKQELMHIAVCTLFDKHFVLTHKDEDGFPHFETVKGIEKINIKEQEELLKHKIVEYFEAL